MPKPDENAVARGVAIAHGAMIDALIATHPAPAALMAAFEVAFKPWMTKDQPPGAGEEANRMGHVIAKRLAVKPNA